MDPPAKSSQIPGARHKTSWYQSTGADEPEALDLALQISEHETQISDILRRRAILAKHGVSEEDALARAIERSHDPAKNDPTETHGHHPDLVAIKVCHGNHSRSRHEYSRQEILIWTTLVQINWKPPVVFIRIGSLKN